MSQFRSRRLRVAALLLSTAAAVPATAAAAPLQGTARIDSSWSWLTPLTDSAIVGDFNGDGRDDQAFIVGDTVRLMYGRTPIRSANLETVETGGQRFTTTGAAPVLVGGAGDFDGDGFDDLLVATAKGGGSFIVYGGAGGANTTTAIKAGANATALPTGSVVYPANSDIGDFDGDGKDDVVVSRTTGVSTSILSGATIVYGGARVATIDATTQTDRTSLLNGTRKCTVYGWTQVCTSTMPQVSGIGDFNGDGKADITVSSPSVATYAMYGRPGRFKNQATTVPTQSTSLGRVGTMPAAGDVNGDGFDDTIAPLASGKGFAVLLGRANPPASLPASAPVITLETKTTGTAKYTLQRAGDQDGDGKDDLIATLPPYFGLPADTPSRMVLLTKLPAPGGATIDLDTASPVPGVPTAGRQAVQSISAPGDLDGDGADDLIAEAGVDASYLLTHSGDRLAPELQRAVPPTLSPSVFYAGNGTQMTVTLDEAATVELVFKTAAGAVAGTERRALVAGKNVIAWKGTVGSATLALGKYTVAFTPVDAAGNRGRVANVPFELSSVDTGPTPAPTAEFKVTYRDTSGAVVPGFQVYIEPRCGTAGAFKGYLVDNGSSVTVKEADGKPLDETVSCSGEGAVQPPVPAALAGCTWSSVYKFNGTVLAHDYTASRLKAGANLWEQISTCVKG